MIQMVVSVVICVLSVGTFLVCYLKSRGQYDDYIEVLDKEEYGLKDFIPLGLVFCETRIFERILPIAVKVSLAKYKNQQYQKVLELRGVKHVQYYSYIHEGYRRSVAIIAATFTSIMSLIFTIQGDTSNGMLLDGLVIISMIAIPFLVDKGLDEKISKRRRMIQMEFPEFVNKLTLLVNAGMTISKAWEKIINENKRDHVLYDEMGYALAEIRAGKQEGIAYEEFARRCHVKEVTKFVSVIVMNLRRGGADVIPVLKAQGTECWEMRKNAAKQLGEEASTKMLIPLMIMFFGIVIIVATPAVLSMTSGM